MALVMEAVYLVLPYSVSQSRQLCLTRAFLLDLFLPYTALLVSRAGESWAVPVIPLRRAPSCLHHQTETSAGCASTAAAGGSYRNSGAGAGGEGRRLVYNIRPEGACNGLNSPGNYRLFCLCLKSWLSFCLLSALVGLDGVLRRS